MASNFIKLGIEDGLYDRLRENGIEKPTPIQSKTIPTLLAGKDVIGKAQTGTGKTLAFMLPIIQRIEKDTESIQALIVAPTRELAIQITQEANKLVDNTPIHLLAAYGGQDVQKQIKKLKGNIHIVIGTPGRLLDHIRRQTIDLSKLRMLVLDEADQMLHMGFLQEVEEIIKRTPKTRQTMFFSATMPKKIQNLASRYMKNPTAIEAESKKVTLDEIKQIVVHTTDRLKQDALCKAIDEYRPFMGIIFCRTKRRTRTLNEALQNRGYNSDELHGDLSQAKREKVMMNFRKMKVQFLVATDVAARGLDIEGITHVFNYDIPQDVESYIHRIGRTGRAGQMGMAITFVAPKDLEALSNIEKGIQRNLKKKDMPVKNTRSHGSQSKKSGEYSKSRDSENKRKGKYKKNNTGDYNKKGFREKAKEKKSYNKKRKSSKKF